MFTFAHACLCVMYVCTCEKERPKVDVFVHACVHVQVCVHMIEKGYIYNVGVWVAEREAMCFCVF